jgi:NitT/TauT family transport system substrate-binding protein
MKRRSLLSYIVIFLATVSLSVACSNPASNMKTDTDTGINQGETTDTQVRLGDF